MKTRDCYRLCVLALAACGGPGFNVGAALDGGAVDGGAVDAVGTIESSSPADAASLDAGADAVDPVDSAPDAYRAAYVLCDTLGQLGRRVYACGQGWRAYDAGELADSSSFTVTLFYGTNASGQPIPVGSCQPSDNAPIVCPPDGGGPGFNGWDCMVNDPSLGVVGQSPQISGRCLQP